MSVVKMASGFHNKRPPLGKGYLQISTISQIWKLPKFEYITIFSRLCVAAVNDYNPNVQPQYMGIRERKIA